MRKTLLSALSLLVGFGAWAALPTVVATQKVKTPEGMVVFEPTLSPDAEFIVASDAASDGLFKIDVATGKSSVIAPTGFDVRISPDSKTVAFRHSVYDKNHLRQTGLKSVDLASGKENVIVKPSRNLNAGMALTANGAYAVENGRMRSRAIGSVKETAPAVASINYGHLEITRNGKTVTIDPQGRGSYLWPSVSPDGTKVVYYLATRGCFVCDLDGSNPVSLGMLRAPQWLDNETIIGMNDIDDGETVLSSSIIASDLKGERAVLTDNSVIAMFPTASADGSKVAFATPAGELYILNLKK